MELYVMQRCMNQIRSREKLNWLEVFDYPKLTKAQRDKMFKRLKNEAYPPGLSRGGLPEATPESMSKMFGG